MSETINKGWIKSPDEIKFAPKTFAEQVIVNGETTLDMELEKYETIKNNCPTLDAEDTEGTCTAGDYVSRIQELEAKNLELTNELAELNSKYLDNIGESTKFTRFVLASGASHTLQKPAYRNMIFFMFRNNELGISSVDQWNASSNSNEKFTVKSTNESSQVASEITVKNNHSVAVIVFAITFHAPGL